MDARVVLIVQLFSKKFSSIIDQFLFSFSCCTFLLIFFLLSFVEPDLYLGHRNITLPPDQLARDFSLLKVVIEEEGASIPSVFGPDVATLDRDNYFSKYLCYLFLLS